MIQPGTYRHYKGNLYTVLFAARHSETEEWHVVYQTQYGDHGHWVRPLTMFTATVTVDGLDIPRFELIESTPAA